MRSLLTILAASALALAGCQTGGNPLVRVAKPVPGGLEAAGCEPVGTTTGPEKEASNKAVALGGDTMTGSEASGWSVYTCDREKAAALRARRESGESVRVAHTNEEVTGCTFLRNVSAESERDAREETRKAKGNVLFIPANPKDSKPKTTGDETPRLNGEAYRCAEKK